MWERILKLSTWHRREIIVAMISVLVFVVVLLFSSRLITFWSNFSIKKEEVKVEAAIQQELQNISTQREQIIASGTLTEILKRNNPLEILKTVQTEAKKRNLGFVIITDREGFVLARSHLPAQAGDNFFLTSAYGRLIAKDETKTITAVARGPQVPLIFVSVSQILDKGLPIGGITISYILDNSYATYFQEKYLKSGEQVVFYTSQEGIVGDSFNDKNKTQLINTYFSLGSDLIAQNLSGLSKEIKIGNEYYAIRNIVFPGIEESPGGAFVFFPIRHSSYSLFLASSVVFFFFLFYYLTVFLLKFLRHHKHRLPILLLTGFVSFIAIYFITLTKLDNSAIELKKSPYRIYNSIIKFVPESDVISQYSEKMVAVKVFTGGEAINAVSTVVNYDPKIVEVLDIVTTNSFCDPSLFLEKEINKEKGEVRIACATPSPGFYDAIGTIAELLIQPLGLKPISLKFTEETQVLVNDGLGTNVLRMTTDGYYQVVRQEFATADLEHPLPIFSFSHPNSNRWYKNKKIKLSWPALAGGIYYYTLSHNPNNPSAKDKILSMTNNYLNISVDDGIYYFYLLTRNATGKSGPISGFKIMIDSTPPLAPKIKASSQTIKKGDIVRLDFTSEDALSGLQSGFYVQMNEGIFLPVKPPFYIPFLDSGDYPIVIRAFDRANNFSDNSIVIHVQG